MIVNQEIGEFYKAEIKFTFVLNLKSLSCASFDWKIMISVAGHLVFPMHKM